MLTAESCVSHVEAVDFRTGYPSFMFFSHRQLMRENIGDGHRRSKIGKLFDSGKVIGIIGGLLVLGSLGSFGHL